MRRRRRSSVTGRGTRRRLHAPRCVGGRGAGNCGCHAPKHEAERDMRGWGGGGGGGMRWELLSII